MPIHSSTITVKARARYQCRTGLRLDQITVIPLIDVVLQVILFFILVSPFAVQPRIPVKLPRTITSDIIREENLIISVTSEDVIYFRNKVVTIKELQSILKNKTRQPVLIKADRRAAMGRIVDIWNICRDAGIENINFATSK